MNLHFSEHIYAAQFRDEWILLDTKRDRYEICFKETSELLSHLFQEKNDQKSHSGSSLKLSTDGQELVTKLLSSKILENKPYPYPFYVDKKTKTVGVSNADWRLPIERENIKFNLQVLTAFLTLIKVNIFMKARGFYQTIKLVQSTYHDKKEYVTPDETELQKLSNIVNKASHFFPWRIKCLEWSITYVLLALKKGWKCNLEIGVQNYPFFAHAWVECNNRVIMDSQELREGMAILLNEPFRRKQK